MERAVLDFGLLPVNEDLRAWLTEEKQSGRPLILATASDQTLAERSVERLGLFEQVLGSDGKRN